MAQWAKALAIKLDDLSSIHGNHVIGGENGLLHVILKTFRYGAREMALMPCKDEDQSLCPQHPCKRWVGTVTASTPSVSEAEYLPPAG